MKKHELVELQRILDCASVNDAASYADKGALTLSQKDFDLFTDALAYISYLEQKQEAIVQTCDDISNVIDSVRAQFEDMQSALDNSNTKLEAIELLAKDLAE